MVGRPMTPRLRRRVKVRKTVHQKHVVLSSNVLTVSFPPFPSGVYSCGPIPVRAIKEGELTFKYDAPFVFAEVNADVITFMKKKDGSTSKVSSNALVGQKISTKSVGSDAREDITHHYKYPEGRSNF